MTATTVAVVSNRNTRRDAGPLSGYLDTFSTELRAQRYAPNTIKQYLAAAQAFGRWLSRHRLGIHEVSESILQCYVASLKRPADRSGSKRRLPHTGVGLRHLLWCLRKSGVLEPTPEVPASTAAERWLEGYEHYLDHVMGRTSATRQRYLYFAKQFLNSYCGTGPLDWNGLRAPVVTEFVQREAQWRSGFGRKAPATAMRVMLRYLVGRGEVPGGLEAAVPRVRHYQQAALPRHLSEADLARVLEACANRTPVGRRDYAMLLVLARLGLRAKEVARLALEDIDWVEGHVGIRAGKTHQDRRLPLAKDLGQAVIAYLKHGRPSSAHRLVFLEHRAPFGPLRTASAITHIVQRALARAGVDVPSGGAHLFRHSAATQMVQRGANFKQVADVLGHHSLQTTRIYAKLDLATLAQVALPWPGGEQP
jgi:site-specific recombinase XerD